MCLPKLWKPTGQQRDGRNSDCMGRTQETDKVEPAHEKKHAKYCICYRILVTLQPLSVQSLAGCRVPCYVAPGRQTILLIKEKWQI